MAANEEVLGALHALVAEQLGLRITAEGASASDLAVAVKFLKDNNITCMPNEDNALGELERKMNERKANRNKTRLTQADLDAAIDATGLLN